MTSLGTPFIKDEIITAYTAESQAVFNYFASIQDDFFNHPPNVWSPAENLIHLIQSCSPVILALGLPRMALRLRFGVMKRPSISLEQVRQNYVNVALAGGGKASGAYLPQVKEKTTADREQILSKWHSKSGQFIEKLANWQETDLDKYQLPHPLLGNLTVREILFFTLYHNMHHVNDVKRLLNEPEVEWFGKA